MATFPRLAVVGSIVCTCVAVVVTVYSQTSQPGSEASRAPRLFAQVVANSRQSLDLSEQRRLAELNQLEFFNVPGPLRKICLLPTPTPAAQIDPHRSLFVHDRATLDAGDFSLKRTLGQIATQVSPLVPGTTAVSIFRQFWDTQNRPPGITAGPHCTGTLNGFPIKCPRAEQQEAAGTDADIETRMNDYAPLALVNRLDLAHKGWRNCGEHRIVYGKRGGGFAKNLVIFEAVLPNPMPGCREGCVPVAEFWKSLSTVDDGGERATRLQKFYYEGIPGFRPVVHVNHYSANGVSTGYGSSGSGQIRTNQFLEVPWTLREFKTVINCSTSPCSFTLEPVMVKVNPQGTLWNEDNADPRAVDFRADTVVQVPKLSAGSLMEIGYEVDLANDAGESVSMAVPGFIDNYRDQMNGATAVTFRAALAMGPLDADTIANRALTQSCAGCHMPSTFQLNAQGSIGTVTAPVGAPVSTIDHWPSPAPAGFVHVDVMPASVRPELAANPAAFGTGMGQEISQALLDFFLPDRKNFLLAQLNAARCSCRNRFTFLRPPLRRRALDIQERVDRQFEPRIEAIDKTLTAEGEARLSDQKQRLIAERNQALAAALKEAGIVVPESGMNDLRPQPMKLPRTAASRLTGAALASVRLAEVIQILQREPPRRTVTGSFRSH